MGELAAEAQLKAEELCRAEAEKVAEITRAKEEAEEAKHRSMELVQTVRDLLQDYLPSLLPSNESWTRGYTHVIDRLKVMVDHKSVDDPGASDSPGPYSAALHAVAPG